MSKDGQATIYDVATLSGVSIATISRVLNSPGKVSEQTRGKVMAAIDELGFVPKAEARAPGAAQHPAHRGINSVLYRTVFRPAAAGDRCGFDAHRTRAHRIYH